jgi:hypothetical protein
MLNVSQCCRHSKENESRVDAGGGGLLINYICHSFTASNITFEINENFLLFFTFYFLSYARTRTHTHQYICTYKVHNQFSC